MDHVAPSGRTEIPESELNDEQRGAASATLAGAASETRQAAGLPASPPLDFFIQRGGQVFAGTHLIIDLSDAKRLDDPEHIEATLISAAEAAGATVLSSDFHIFTPNNGVSGVVVLAESHVSIHTWPERDFAALDIFMGGEADPMRAIPVLKQAFRPGGVTLQEIKRGLQA